MPMNQCCCFSLRTGCFSAAIFCAVENLCYCVGIAVRYQMIEDEIPDEIEHKVMSAFLVYLIISSGMMFVFNLAFIVGTIFDWKHVIFGWVIVYSMLLGMRSVVFISAGALCIMIQTCNSILGIMMFCAGYIPMGGTKDKLWNPSDRSVVCSNHCMECDYKPDLKLKRLKPDAVPSVFSDYPPTFHSFFVMVVHGYFRYLQPVVREMPVFIVSRRGESLQRRYLSPRFASRRTSHKEATHKPNPEQATNKPNPKELSPKEATHKPNPRQATNTPNPKEPSNKPNPKEATNKRNPKVRPNRSNPKEPNYRPIPKEWASHLLCYCERELKNK